MSSPRPESTSLSAALFAAAPLAVLGRAARTLAVLALAGSIGAPALAQGTNRPDQVLHQNARGTVITFTGTVLEATLDKVTMVVDGSERTVDGQDVVEVLYGTVPPAMAEARQYRSRGDFKTAAARYKTAAGDASASDAVRARARMRASEMFLRDGASDPSSFGLARTEAESFTKEFPNSRDLPRARYLLGRAQRLSGDAAAAAATYRSLATDATGETPLESYPRVLGFRAALGAADALLAAGDGAAARELYLSIDASLPAIIATVSDSRDALELQRFQAEARLGEGFVMLANGELSQARTFFQGQANADNPAQRFGALLGLGETHLADGKYREAQLALGEVAALDHTNRDRVARALVGLAKALVELPDSTSSAAAKDRIRIVLTRYGDTPAVLEAAEMARKLQVDLPASGGRGAARAEDSDGDDADDSESG